jgi:hypothetical protein
MVGLLSGAAFGQTAINGYYKTFAGTAADTLTASVTKAYTLDMGYTGSWQGKVYDYTIQLFSDYVSGTSTFTVKLYESVDGTNWTATALDSLSKVHASDFNYVKTMSSRTARYIKVSAIATSATQKSSLYGYISVGKHY